MITYVSGSITIVAEDVAGEPAAIQTIPVQFMSGYTFNVNSSERGLKGNLNVETLNGKLSISVQASNAQTMMAIFTSDEAAAYVVAEEKRKLEKMREEIVSALREQGYSVKMERGGIAATKVERRRSGFGGLGNDFDPEDFFRQAGFNDPYPGGFDPDWFKQKDRW